MAVQKYRLVRDLQFSIFTVLTALRDHPKVAVTFASIHTGEDDKQQEQRSINKIIITHLNKFVPDAEMEWCPVKKHFRVYFHMAERSEEKRRAGYSVFIIRTKLEATMFVQIYSFFCRNRANNKEESYNADQLSLQV